MLTKIKTIKIKDSKFKICEIENRCDKNKMKRKMATIKRIRKYEEKKKLPVINGKKRRNACNKG